AGDRYAELCSGRGDAEVAGAGDGDAAAGAEARHRGDGRNRTALDDLERRIHLALVPDAVLARREVAELGDVRAGGEGLVARAGDHDHLGLAGLRNSVADFG